MNFFLRRYSTDTHKGKDSFGWFEFGKTQLAKLYRLLSIPLNDNELEAFVNKYAYCEKPKGIILFSPDKINTDIYFLIDGTVKIYYQHEKYVQIVSLIAPGGIVTSVNSFLNQSPGRVYIETCERCRFLFLKKEEFVSEWFMSKQVYNLLIGGMLKSALEYQSLITDLLYLKSEEKIDFLYQKYPELFSNFALKEISSLIGMEPETLSRTRKKLANKKLK